MRSFAFHRPSTLYETSALLGGVGQVEEEHFAGVRGYGQRFAVWCIRKRGGRGQVLIGEDGAILWFVLAQVPQLDRWVSFGLEHPPDCQSAIWPARHRTMARIWAASGRPDSSRAVVTG